MRLTVAVPVSSTSKVTLTNGFSVVNSHGIVLELEPLILPLLGSDATTPLALGIMLPVAELL